MWPLMSLLVGFSLVNALYFGGLRVISGVLSIGQLTAFLIYLVMLIRPMIAFGWVINILQQGSASMARLARILDTEPEIRDTAHADFSIQNILGEIVFHNVRFTHQASDRESLRGIDLMIPQGTTLAIVGHTGAGKSTLVNLIQRLYDVTEGELLIDGKNVKEIPLHVLREQIGYVPQETFLFSGSIGENHQLGHRQVQRRTFARGCQSLPYR